MGSTLFVLASRINTSRMWGVFLCIESPLKCELEQTDVMMKRNVPQLRDYDNDDDYDYDNEQQ